MRALLLVLLLLAPCARAADRQPCDAATFKIAGRFAGYADFTSEGDVPRVVAAACKPAPDQPGLLLAAFAYSTQPGAKPPPDEDDKQLAVLVIDSARGRVVASHKELVSEDAITRFGPDSLSLDTARYLLAPGVRAFGLRFSSTANGPSCADGYFGEPLTLFVAEGGTLRPVLKLDMSTAQALAGCIGHGGPGSVVESATLTLAIAPTRSKGYADLAVRAKIDAWGGDEAKNVPKPRTETRVLHYDGRRYAVPSGEAWWLMDY